MHGGKRNGAGRKPNSQTTKTRLIAEQAVAEGVSPLDVMLHAMRHFYAKKQWAKAAAIARDAAAFVHPRLASIQMSAEEKQTVRLITELVIVDASSNNGRAPHVVNPSGPGRLPA